MTIVLPTKAEKAHTINPRVLFIFSQTKVWKTELALSLENNLVIDLESWSSYYDWMRFDVREYALQNDMSIKEAFAELIKSLKESKKNWHQYEYITIDTATALEDIALELALELYKASPTWKNFSWTSVINLPNWSWYWWLREAFEKIYMQIKLLPSKCIILLWHVKNSSILKDWEEISVRDINLTWKQKFIVCADSDAIWYMYRNPKNPKQNLIEFGTDQTTTVSWSRAKHLANTQFVISEIIDWSLVTYRDKIFIKESINDITQNEG